MKIAFVNDTFLEGRGADSVIYELVRRLGKKHDIFVIISESDMPKENFKILKVNARKLLTGNTLVDSLSYFPNLIKFRKELLKLQKKYNFDVFNLHHSSLNPAMKGLPTIVTWHGSPPSKNKIRIFFNKIVLKSLKRNKISIVISDYMKDKLSKTINPKQIKIIYNGVSKEFKPIGKDKEFMFFAGRLEEHKAVHEVIRLSKDLDYPIQIVGSGPLEGKLKNYSKKISADKVKFLGKIPRKDLIKKYQECSFFISGSKWEGFGLIFLEAAACGKPSIGYKKGAILEVVSNGKTGFVVNNYEELKQKAGELIKDKTLRRKMGKEALRFSKKFSWEKSAQEYEKMFNQISKKIIFA